MNYKLVIHNLGAILLLEAATMVPSLAVSLLYGDGAWFSFVLTIGLLVLVALPAWKLVHPEEKNLRAREGFLTVSLCWVMMSIFGAMPFVFSGVLPSAADAFFETVSGFTTTGSTVLPSFEGQPQSIMFWRSFTHWLGGMGVLVLSLIFLPRISGRTSHLVRAESAGPTLSKIVPRMSDTAKILYVVYGALSLLLFVCLLLTGLSPFDAAIHTFGTAGTGGFSNYAMSVGQLNNVAAEIVMTVFMIVFSTNMAMYFRIIRGEWRDALKSEELRWFLSIVAVFMVLVTLTIWPEYGSLATALRHGTFQVASIISTSGFATVDFNLWAPAAQLLLLLLMFVGACVGSTGGGPKVGRIALMVKAARREVHHTFQPRKVQVLRFEGRGVEDTLISQIAMFLVIYVGIMLLGAMLISLDGVHDLKTNLTAAITCVSNVGPGFGAVGPMGNFAEYSVFSKLVLSLLMLAGRLEIYPILVLFSPVIWRRN